MNKIIIVGHPSSGYKEVEELLQNAGMGKAIPSKRDHYTPVQISQIICKSHGVIKPFYSRTDFTQINPGSVWDGMALDLLVANVDQPLWGWSDPSVIHLLNYWKALESQIGFVLVYDNPEKVLSRILREPNVDTNLQHKVYSHLNNWLNYNTELLNFYLNNSERCLLVHSEQVMTSVARYLQKMHHLIQLDEDLLQIPENNNEHLLQIKTESIEVAAKIKKQNNSLITDTKIEDLVSIDDGSLVESELDSPSCHLEMFLSQLLIKQYPQILKLYSELQASSVLPLIDNANKENPFNYKSILTAWQSFATQQSTNKQLKEEFLKYNQSNQKLKEKLANTEEKLNSNLNKQKKLIADKQSSYSKDKELLLTQLHQTQGQLEQYISEYSALKKELDALEKVKDDAEKLSFSYKKLKEENQTLMHQLHSSQEQLEQLHYETLRLKEEKIHQKTKGFYGAAKRIKGEVEYRLGACMIEHSRSLKGWLSMSKALREIRQKFEDNDPAFSSNLPPVEQYLDYNEAKKVQKHLSYRLGRVLTAYQGKAFSRIKLPFALYSEVKAFRREKKSPTAVR